MNHAFQIDEAIKIKFMMLNLLNNWGTSIDLDVYTVSPDKVEGYLQNNDWENLTLEIANNFRNTMLVKDKEIGLCWNQYAADARNFIKSKLINNISLSFSQNVIGYVIWDLIHLILYFQFKSMLNINEILFYEKCFLIYKKGNFPCGWVGSYPNGNFLVV